MKRKKPINAFSSSFKPYTCDGDSITATVEDFDVTAKIYRDDDSDAPDQRQDGFWPSLDPKADGYIGAKSKRSLQRETAKMQNVLDTWKKDEWWYVGVSVTVSKCGVKLVDDYETALWGIECNYPGSDNSYLTEAANELLPEAITAAKAKLSELCAPEALTIAEQVLSPEVAQEKLTPGKLRTYEAYHRTPTT